MYQTQQQPCYVEDCEGVEGINNPPIPYLGPIPELFVPGTIIRVIGYVPANSVRFVMNLQYGPNSPRDDIALHNAFRFAENRLIRNHLVSLAWGQPEKLMLPLKQGCPFEAIFLCETNSIRMSFNGRQLPPYAHRIPFHRITHFSVCGDVQVSSISYKVPRRKPDCSTPCPPPCQTTCQTSCKTPCPPPCPTPCPTVPTCPTVVPACPPPCPKVVPACQTAPVCPTPCPKMTCPLQPCRDNPQALGPPYPCCSTLEQTPTEFDDLPECGFAAQEECTDCFQSGGRSLRGDDPGTSPSVASIQAHSHDSLLHFAADDWGSNSELMALCERKKKRFYY